jgi:hypothetical protein
VLGCLRENGTMTMADLRHRSHLSKDLRDTLVERLAAEELVLLDGKNVTATSYQEFVTRINSRKELPQPVDLRDALARQLRSSDFLHFAAWASCLNHR